MDMNDVTVFLTNLLLFLNEVLVGYLEFFYRLIFPLPLKSVTGETALITGAGHGIGRELALQLSKLGVKVVCWDINESSAKGTAKEIEASGGQAWAYKCDVSNREQISETAQKVRSDVGPITILFNNAGIMPCKPFLKHNSEDVERTFKVNVFSQMYMLLEFLPEFLEMNRGHIVAMSSLAGLTGTPNLTVYCSSKFAIKGLMDALFLEHRAFYPKSNVKMTTIHPFTVNTGLAKKPFNRFNSFLPIVEASEAARIIIEAMRRNEEYAYVPKVLSGLCAFGRAFPRRVQLALTDFLAAGVESDES